MILSVYNVCIFAILACPFCYILMLSIVIVYIMNYELWMNICKLCLHYERYNSNFYDVCFHRNVFCNKIQNYLVQDRFQNKWYILWQENLILRNWFEFKRNLRMATKFKYSLDLWNKLAIKSSENCALNLVGIFFVFMSKIADFTFMKIEQFPLPNDSVDHYCLRTTKIIAASQQLLVYV